MIIGAIAIVLIGFIARNYVRMYNRYMQAETRLSNLRKETRKDRSQKWAQDASTFVLLFTMLTGCGSSAYIATPDSGRVSLECATGVDVEVAQSAIEALVPEAAGQIVVKRCVQKAGTNGWGLFLSLLVFFGVARRVSFKKDWEYDSDGNLWTVDSAPEEEEVHYEEAPRSHGEGAFLAVLLVLFLLILGFVGGDDATKQPLLDGEAADHGTVRTEVRAVAPAPGMDNTMPWIRTWVRERIEGTGWTEGDVLWMARAAYSESARRHDDHEIELIMWTIRNRVDTGYRVEFVLPGAGVVYRAVLADRQFSYFNDEDDPQGYRTMGFHTQRKHWEEFITLAVQVLTAMPWDRPFDITTRHFISPETMKALNKPMPKWTKEGVVEKRTPDFVFYSGVA